MYVYVIAILARQYMKLAVRLVENFDVAQFVLPANSDFDFLIVIISRHIMY